MLRSSLKRFSYTMYNAVVFFSLHVYRNENERMNEYSIFHVRASIQNALGIDYTCGQKFLDSITCADSTLFKISKKKNIICFEKFVFASSKC